LPINKKALQMQGYLTFSHSSTIALGILSSRNLAPSSIADAFSWTWL